MSKRALVAIALALAMGGIWLLAPSGALAAEQDDLPYVKSIEIVGNQAFSGGALKKLMRTQERRFYQIFSRPRYVRDLLRRDLATLEAFYHRAGFYEVQVMSLGEEDIRFDEKSFSVRIRIRIEEGKRRYVRQLSFAPDLGATEKKLRARLALAPGQPFDPQGPGLDMARIQVTLKEEGNFSAQVSFSTRLIPSPAGAPTDSLDLRYTIERGPPARLGDIRYEGYDISLSLITRELTIKEGEPLRLGQLMDSKQNLLDTGYFRTVDFLLNAPADSSRTPLQQLDATWVLRERKMAIFEAGVGWGTADGFNISGDWRHHNVFNIGQRVALSAVFTLNSRRRSFGLSYDRQTLEYSFLRIVRARTFLNAALTRERDSQPISPPGMNAVENWAVRLGAARRFSFETVAKLTGQVDFTSQEYDSSTIDLETRSLTVLLDRDTRNDVLNPWLGGQHRFSYTWAGGILGGDNDYHRFTWNQSHHRRRGGGIFAAHLFAGTVWAFGDSKGDVPGGLPNRGVPPDGVPLEARFYSGGLATVRGYYQQSLGPRIPMSPWEDPRTVDPANPIGDPLGGRFSLLMNLEWRTPVRILGRENFQAVFFLDGGNAWLDVDDMSLAKFFPWQAGDSDDLTRMFYSLGVGFRYITPIVIIRMDFGAPLQPLTGNDSQWHLSLGHIF